VTTYRPPISKLHTITVSEITAVGIMRVQIMLFLPGVVIALRYRWVEHSGGPDGFYATLRARARVRVREASGKFDIVPKILRRAASEAQQIKWWRVYPYRFNTPARAREKRS